MHSNSRIAVIVVAAMGFGGAPAVAQDPTTEAEIKRLEDETKLDEARRKRAEAAKAAADAEKALRDSQASLSRQADDAATLDIQQDAAKKAAEVAKDLAVVSKLKETLGEPPAIGKEGAATFTEAGNTMLLRARAGSLLAVDWAATRICADLTSSKVSKAISYAPEYDAKLQKGRQFRAELAGMKALSQRVDTELGNSGVDLQSVPALIGGITAARYLIGGIGELSKLARSDFALGIANAAASRTAMLEIMVGKRCPAEVSLVRLESVLRNASPDDFLTTVNAIAKSIDTFDGAVAQVTAEIVSTTAELTRVRAELQESKATLDKLDAALKAELAKKPNERNGEYLALVQRQISGATQRLEEQKVKESAMQNDLAGKTQVSNRLKGAGTHTARLKQFFESLRGNEAQLLENIAWGSFDSSAHAKSDRFSYVLTAQDIQVQKDSFFSGKRVGGASTVEVIYQVVSVDGAVKAAGAVSASAGGSQFDLGNMTEALCLSGRSMQTAAAIKGCTEQFTTMLKN